MPSVPRIIRAVPKGAITRPEQPLPVLATIRWHHGVDKDVLAIAIAWTRDAAEIAWEIEVGKGFRTDWIPATDVRRSLDAPAPVNDVPHTRAGRPRARW
jgi:hypothetical protein